MDYKIKSVVFGHAVGDALGVPVEFASRSELDKNPVEDMEGYGTYPFPAGCWSLWPVSEKQVKPRVLRCRLCPHSMMCLC